MPDAIPACFRCVAAAPSGAGGVGPSLATSVYETHLGLAALSWSRNALGLCLRAVLRISLPPTPGSASSSVCDYESDEETLAVRVRPWLFWKRRGSKRFHVCDRRVDLAWDLTRARFACAGQPEPSSGFFVAVIVDGEMVLVAGDLVDEAYRKTRAQRPPCSSHPVLISRREHVSMHDAGHGRSHKTCVTVRGKEREISVDLVSRGHGKAKDKDKDKTDVGMSIAVDGERVLHVRRLRWKFRGSEKVDLGGGDRVQVSWDLHNWLFPPRDPAPPDAAASAASPAHAVFVFRFELSGGGGEECEPEKELFDKPGVPGVGGWRGYFGRWGKGDWSESSSNGERRRKGKGRGLAKASSSSSASVASSTASWASGSTVMDWASPEEAEMQRGDGFSLLVYAWKS